MGDVPPRAAPILSLTELPFLGIMETKTAVYMTDIKDMTRQQERFPLPG